MAADAILILDGPSLPGELPAELPAKVWCERVAEDEGVSLSALAWHALEDYLSSRAS
jgi:hypothetical protein